MLRSDDAAVAGLSHVHTFDFIDDLCIARTCSTARNGVWLYHDGDHLSNFGSALLAPRFASLLESQAGQS